VKRRHVFGVKGDVRDNVHYLDETTVLYAAGNQIVLHHVESNTQRFIPGSPDAEGITALALSPNRKYLAVAERAEKATISVIDITTHAKRRKVLCSAEVNAKVRSAGSEKARSTKGSVRLRRARRFSNPSSAVSSPSRTHLTPHASDVLTRYPSFTLLFARVKPSNLQNRRNT